MTNTLLLPELRELLATQQTDVLKEVLKSLHPARIADLSEGLQQEEVWQLLEALPLHLQTQVFPFYSPAMQQQLVAGIGHEHVSRLLMIMSHDDRVDLLRHLQPGVVEQLLPLIDQTERDDIRHLLSFPEGSVGSIMTTDFATLPADIDVAQALNRVRQQARTVETIYYVYVVDEARHLHGVVTLRDLVLAEPTASIREIMESEVISTRASQDQEKVASDLAKYDFLAIPVVDDQHRLIGMVTFDDIADVLAEEMTEDFHLSAAVAPLVESYSQSKIRALYHRRVGWLVILIFVNLASSGVIAAFEETLQAMIALAFFLPLLIDSGGNTGSQAATLIVRALSTSEVKLLDWCRILAKEFLVGLSLGLTMALASFVLGYFRGGLEVGLIVGLSMLGIVVFTNLVGTMLPFLLTRLNLDPAVASSPLITTVADASGLFLYFSIATWVTQLIGLGAH